MRPENKTQVTIEHTRAIRPWTKLWTGPIDVQRHVPMAQTVLKTCVVQQS